MYSIEIFFIAAGIGLLALSFWIGQRQNGQSHSGAQTPVPSTASINHALKLQNSLNELLQELQGLSQEITDDLEGKLGQLKDLIRLADNRCEQLAAAGLGNGGQNSFSNLQNEEPPDSGDHPASDLHVTVEDEETPPMPSTRYQQIYQMADEGLSLDEIARQVGMGKGEVQLILSLRRKK